MNLRQQLHQRVGAAMAAAGCGDDADPLLRPADPKFGDYQANGVMAAAKRQKTNPRQLAEKVLENLDPGDWGEQLSVAGPGFINIRLKDDFLTGQLSAVQEDPKLGTPPHEHPQQVVVDYSHPNLAKEMHVGHLRSTIIGDAICRVLEFLGEKVLRHNHVGDWGTQFGMLLAYLDEREAAGQSASGELADLEGFYRAAKERFDSDPAFADTARGAVVKLQAGDDHYRQVWQTFIDESLRHCQAVYDQLNITLTPEDVVPESFYNDDLPKVIDDLASAGLLTQSQGAQCVFLEEFTGADGEPLPVIVRKSDGGYLYATTDLAAIRYRAGQLAADRVLYIVDARQTLHLRQVFAVARAAGFCPEQCSLEHHPFGTMMGADGKPFKTRAGGTVKLTALLDEAVDRARKLLDEKNPDLPAEDRPAVARAVGIGAVKYADLSQNRASDYVFSWDKMLSLDGNTAPYMQYAYARIRSIFRKGGGEDIPAGDIDLATEAERLLGLKLLQFPETVESVARECLPNVLCAYLYELAGAFMGFYENCPVLAAEGELRNSRLRLCALTARAVHTGLSLLGIQTPERM